MYFSKKIPKKCKVIFRVSWKNEFGSIWQPCFLVTGKNNKGVSNYRQIFLSTAKNCGREEGSIRLFNFLLPHWISGLTKS